MALLLLIAAWSEVIAAQLHDSGGSIALAQRLSQRYSIAVLHYYCHTVASDPMHAVSLRDR